METQVQAGQSNDGLQQTQNNQILTRGNLVMANQQVHLQVMNDNTTWVKYEIIQPETME